MFEKGSFVYYGTAGVCKVSDICSSPFDGNDDKMYYVLAPNDFDNGTVIYAPADNDKVLLRALITAEEAENLLSSVKTLAPLEITNEKHRREEYRNALKDGAPETIARVIKTIHLRKAAMLNTKKRLSDTDTEFDKIARRALLGELSASLGIASAEAEERLNTALEG
ncbi:MAG: CarD family transcriptional regulator [Clostridia bacterium]|nr:CarD family transcriptional regulator [Clostridia bacterium]